MGHGINNGVIIIEGIVRYDWAEDIWDSVE